MDWIDTNNVPNPLALEKKVDLHCPLKKPEITEQLQGIGGASAQAVPPPQNSFAVRPSRGVVQPVPLMDRRTIGSMEVSTMIKTKSAAMLAVLTLAERLTTGSTKPILILGETGTGKTTIAQQIHTWSGRTGPFVRVNCAGLSETLGESELFGHTSRAFTGAGDAKGGRVAEATGGTLFLDEIGELSPDLQKKILDLVELKTYRPVGAGAKEMTADVRIVAATHRDLAAMVEDGKFRKDLLMRLRLSLTMPSLKERGDDIPDLIAEICQREGYDVSEDVIDVLRFAEYPGNIRQLEGMLESASLGWWTREQAVAETSKIGTLPVRVRVSSKPARMVGEDRLSVARELSAARKESGGWWAVPDLVGAAGVSRRTINTDLTNWLASGEVVQRGVARSLQYRAVSCDCKELQDSAKEQAEGEDVG